MGLKPELALTSRVLFLGLLALLVAALPSRAVEIFGFRLFEPPEDETVAVLDPVVYSAGVAVTPDLSEIDATVRAASALVRMRDRPASGAVGLLGSARRDYGKIIDALYGIGRYGGTVSIRVNGGEVADLPFDAAVAQPANVEISVDAGPVYTFASAVIENAGPGTDLTGTGFAVGEPARSGAIRDAGLAAVAAWQDAGHAKARVIEADVVADHAANRLEARLVIEPGPPTPYGEIIVSGTKRIDPDFVRYMADLPRGKPYNPADVREARERLLALDTFRVVDIHDGGDVAPDGTLPVEISVTDRLPRRFGVGASYSSTDGAGVEGFWLHRNLFGRAERLRFDGAIVGIGRSSDPNDYDYTGTTTFIKPGVFTPDTDFEASFGAAFENQPNFTALTLDISAGFTTRISEYVDADFKIVSQRSRVDDAFGRRRFNVVGPEFTLTFDDRDDTLDAKRGSFAEAEIFPFVESKRFSEIAVRSTVEVRNYQTFGENDLVTLAGRARLGSITGIAQNRVPSQFLFFSGGGGSVRGYPFLSNGVDQPGGGVIGGLSLLEISGEVRTRITDTIGVVGFVDAGLVSADALPDLSDPFEVGVGVGLRYNTGFGPLRIDVARGLDLDPGDPQFGLYIGLGQAF